MELSHRSKSEPVNVLWMLLSHRSSHVPKRSGWKLQPPPTNTTPPPHPQSYSVATCCIFLPSFWHQYPNCSHLFDRHKDIQVLLIKGIPKKLHGLHNLGWLVFIFLKKKKGRGGENGKESWNLSLSVWKNILFYLKSKLSRTSFSITELQFCWCKSCYVEDTRNYQTQSHCITWEF